MRISRALAAAVFAHAISASTAAAGLCADNTRLIDVVRNQRKRKAAGLAAGGTVLAGGIIAGIGSGILTPEIPVGVLATGAAGAAALDFVLRVTNDEARQPLDEASHFEVRASIDPAKGNGLFAKLPIDEGTYLFAYEGEVLDEDAMFARYPNADGRYIACITDNLYIDGVDPFLSNVARWMNHAGPEKANVFWKKQRRGENKAMHFYALRDIAPDAELCFDYGSDYWQALGVEPID